VTNAFGGRALPGPAGGASAFLPDPLAAIGVGVLLLRGRERKGEDEDEANLGFFRGGDFGNPSERSERALRGSGLTGK